MNGNTHQSSQATPSSTSNNDGRKAFNAVIGRAACIAAVVIATTGCQSVQSQPKATAKVDAGLSERLGPYSGPKASVAMAKFEWKVGGAGSGGYQVQTPEGTYSVNFSVANQYMGGLGDMLTTALVQSDRFRVMERQDFDSTTRSEVGLSEAGWTSEETSNKKGSVRGADLQIVAAITGWEPNASGKKARGFGAGLLRRIPFVGGGGVGWKKNKAMAAMDIRIIDTETSEVLAATRVEGESTDSKFDFSGIGFGIGGIGLGGLGEYENTPMETAIRVMLNEAVVFLAEETPREYFRHGTRNIASDTSDTTNTEPLATTADAR